MNTEVEQFYLGAILLDGSLIHESRLTVDHFTQGEHKAIFAKMLEMRQDGEVADTVAFAMLPEEELKRCGGRDYVNGLAMSCPSESAFENFENGIIRETTNRKAKQIANEYLFDTDKRALEKMIERIGKIEMDTTKQVLSFKEMLSVRQKEHLESPEHGINGVDTGFDDLNGMIESYTPGDLIIIGARPSMGKTAFALNSMINAARSGDVYPTFFSIEMSEKQVVDRMIATVGKINLMKMKNPMRFFDKKGDWDRYQAAMKELNKLNMSIHNDNTVPDMRAVVRKNIRENPNHKHIVFIDFLTMIRSTEPKNTRHHEIEDIILGLKRIATELNVPVVVLAQLSRSLEQRENKRPMLSDLRESGAIEQTADVVFFLYRDDYYNDESDTGVTEILIGKNRNGPIGMVELAFVKETNTFYQISRR